MNKSFTLVLAFALGVVLTLLVTSLAQLLALETTTPTVELNEEVSEEVTETEPSQIRVFLELSEFYQLVGVAYYFGYWTSVAVPELVKAVETDDDKSVKHWCEYLHNKLEWKDEKIKAWILEYAEEREFDDKEKYCLLLSYARTVLAAERESNKTIDLIRDMTEDEVDCTVDITPE
ncbi:MAG: hypothetical protein OXO49_00790 [Gammaproteobacteria bacterium]|nr:hypothetical protein [Gammaproteobacteria bacterium]MDE0252689.1 hypothetical protein [Gammaproteobacteria bacterium]MDE0402377.1 hypothetical protein [Gammaproteobacteria bacterium]